MNIARWLIVFTLLAVARGAVATDRGELQNEQVTWRWRSTGSRLVSILASRQSGTELPLTGPVFQVALSDGRILSSSDFKWSATPRVVALRAEPDSPVRARQFAGRQLVLQMVNDSAHLGATWTASLRKGSSYLRESLTLRAIGQDVYIKEITLFDEQVPGAAVCGQVDGSPVVAREWFLGYEHPMAHNSVGADQRVRCRLGRNAVLKAGEELTQSVMLGRAPLGQTRRAFLDYLERERAHPYRPFFHYNSWFDIAWDKRKFNETECLDVIEQFGRQLVRARSVRMDSFLFDDGWDDSRTLWKFHAGFPQGFSRVREAAARYRSGIGVWISPFGGYDEARRQRLEYAGQHGYETNASGFSLAGPKYFGLFHEICLEMVRKYGVNQFKFDGLAAGAKASENGLTRDGDAMLRLVSDLRAASPNLYINQTVGTWPSPFWLLSVDSTWRGGDDHAFIGAGTPCQQWLTYRDAQVYQNVAKVAPLYPLNSLMLHGVIYATNASRLAQLSEGDFADQVWSFFGSGTQLQEMYLSPGLMNARNWDDLAAAATWARRNADVLVDTHWIGGDPAQGDVYGWASWTQRKGIVVLRNPRAEPATVNADLAAWFELPAGAPGQFQLSQPSNHSTPRAPTHWSAGSPLEIPLQPFEVLVLEAQPAARAIKTSTSR